MLLGLSPIDLLISGKGVMNAFVAFNSNQLVVSKDGPQVGAEQGGEHVGPAERPSCHLMTGWRRVS